MSTMAHFISPAIQENPGGWGPCSVPEQYKDMPYQPFSKGDRLGKVSLSAVQCTICNAQCGEGVKIALGVIF